MRHYAMVGLFATLCLGMLVAQATKKQAPAKPLPTAGKADQPKLKAIWEPVNYGKDIDLLDVAFASALEG